MTTSRFERLFSRLREEPGKPAIVFEGRTWTFADLDRLSGIYARGLASAGVARGDRVAVFAPTCPEVVIALLGHYRLGAVHVPVNTRYRGEEIAHILSDSGASAVLLGPGEAETDSFQELTLRVRLGGEAPGAGDVRFDDLVSEGSAGSSDPPSLSDEDTAILLYTSGTTGKSKGVELSFRAIVENMEAVTGLWRFSPADRMALALPLFHVHGLGLGIHGALLNRMTVLLFERFDAARIAEAFATGGATLFQGVPTMYVKLLELAGSDPRAAEALSRARLFTSGSAPLPGDDFRRFEELTGHRILERYGMSETLFTLSNLYDDRRPGTVGRPVPGCEVRIVDESGADSPGDEPGELLVRSNGMMTRYRGRPEETAASFRGDWFATGDMGRRGADGFVTIAGRKSVDFIKSGGFKISAREIEDVLRRHPRIREVAVLGAPDRVWGERIVAAVVLRPDPGPGISSEALLEELSAFCARSLADYKRPREVRVVEELPRNALGKVQKHRLREETGTR
ncbi:MAG TPA: AMP-binding protein [Thermoanaerobaculia bacterium]|nr:AMP-binding protein [Thermoanaerobaculia bacterium]